uniref:Uncharacterized protein n=1 Tax=Acrobeloides nanus TaxID=290746 RepID=A0A914DXL1_9BILA
MACCRYRCSCYRLWGNCRIDVFKKIELGEVKGELREVIGELGEVKDEIKGLGHKVTVYTGLTVIAIGFMLKVIYD